MNTMRDLTIDELESVSGGDGVGGIPGAILKIGQGMEFFGDDPTETQNSTGGIPLCGGAIKVPVCMLP